MVVLVSDIHFGSHEEGALDALMKAVTRDVDGCVVIAGDLTQDSRLEEFDRVTKLLTELTAAGVTVVCVPGNHDMGSQVLNFYLHMSWASTNYDTATVRLAAALAPVRGQAHTVASMGYDSLVALPARAVAGHGRVVDAFLGLNSQHRAGARIKKSQIGWSVAAIGALQRRLSEEDAERGDDGAGATRLRLHFVAHHSLWRDSGVDKHLPMARRRRLEEELLRPFGFFSYIHGHNHRHSFQNTTTPKTAMRIRRVSCPTLSTRNKKHERGFLTWPLASMDADAMPSLVDVTDGTATTLEDVEVAAEGEYVGDEEMKAEADAVDGASGGAGGAADASLQVLRLERENSALREAARGGSSTGAADAGSTSDDKLPPIVQLGHPVLRMRARELSVEEISTPRVQTLIDTMIEVMRNAPGVGLAAPQIGEPLMLFVYEERREVVDSLPDSVRVAKAREAFDVRVAINPRVEVLDDEGSARFFEGCLSLKGMSGVVDRALHVKLTCLDRTGAEVVDDAHGWRARIIQHEYDHCCGTVYVDRVLTRTLRVNEHSSQPLPDGIVEGPTPAADE